MYHQQHEDTERFVKDSWNHSKTVKLYRFQKPDDFLDVCYQTKCIWSVPVARDVIELEWIDCNSFAVASSSGFSSLFYLWVTEATMLRKRTFGSRICINNPALDCLRFGEVIFNSGNCSEKIMSSAENATTPNSAQKKLKQRLNRRSKKVPGNWRFFMKVFSIFQIDSFNVRRPFTGQSKRWEVRRRR
jgi:hypothetical protein